MKHYTLTALIIFSSISAYAVAPITGTPYVCAGSTVTLSDASTGGAWSSSATSTATIGTDGTVRGVAPGVATISYTLSGSTTILSFTVNPLPMLSSTLTPAAICDSTIFSYEPLSSTPGTSFNWSHATVLGLSTLSSAGTGNPYETLINVSPNAIAVVYTYTLTASGCTSIEDVITTVNPTPVLSSALTLPNICDSNAMVNYTPRSATPGATFAWDRPAIAGITPSTSFSAAGAGVITELLIDATHHAVTITYFYRLAIGVCPNLNTQTVTVKIDTCVSLATTIAAKEEPLEIIPNPTTGPITINNLQPGDEIEIYSLLGKKVFNSKQLSGSSASISLTNEPSGVYYVRINSAGNIQTQKIVKQ